MGFFPAPSFLSREIAAEDGLVLLGSTSDVRERFYAISVERRLRHPAVVALAQAGSARLA